MTGVLRRLLAVILGVPAMLVLLMVFPFVGLGGIVAWIIVNGASFETALDWYFDNVVDGAFDVFMHIAGTSKGRLE